MCSLKNNDKKECTHVQGHPLSLQAYSNCSVSEDAKPMAVYYTDTNTVKYQLNLSYPIIAT